MKRCHYCGAEYADDVVRCPVDQEPLPGPEPAPIISEAVVQPPARFPNFELNERQMRIFELLLVCAIAFGGSLITSLYHFKFPPQVRDDTNYSSYYLWYRWSPNLVKDCCALALLWYVLARRGKSFADLGFTWTRKDILPSIALRIIGSAVFLAFTHLWHWANPHQAKFNTSAYLFGGGATLVAALLQFVNPFFEELIVRAFFMTEIRFLTGSAGIAVIASAVLQASYHLYQGGPAAFSHLLTFLIWSIYYAKTNRITPIILAHLYNDVGSYLLYCFRT